MVKKIISGGQTGVDQAALDAAIAAEIPHGGFLPAGRMTENGPLSTRYQMEVLESPAYPARTRKNVESADATLIISRGPLTGGSKLTEAIAMQEKKPCLHVDLDEGEISQSLVEAERWLQAVRPEILNVAGPRASSDPLIYREALAFVQELLKIDWR